MKKYIKIVFITSLIISTTFIKSSTKDLEHELYNTQEEIGLLKEEMQMLRLEHDYLTSPQKLLEYKHMYFEGDLKQKKIKNFNSIYIDDDKFSIKEFKFNKNEK